MNRCDGPLGHRHGSQLLQNKANLAAMTQSTNVSVVPSNAPRATLNTQHPWENVTGWKERRKLVTQVRMSEDKKLMSGTQMLHDPRHEIHSSIGCPIAYVSVTRGIQQSQHDLGPLDLHGQLVAIQRASGALTPSIDLGSLLTESR